MASIPISGGGQIGRGLGVFKGGKEEDPISRPDPPIPPAPLSPFHIRIFLYARLIAGDQSSQLSRTISAIVVRGGPGRHHLGFC